MANYDAQINILVSGQRNINNLANQLNQIESSITEIESRWRSASDAFQRSEIRLRAAGTRQPRGEGGRFARDPDRQARFRAYADRRRALVEQRLARISLSRTTAEAAASREQIDNNERLLRQTERRISFESRLNTANERYQYRLQKLRRGGGGRNLSQELQDQARSIQNAYNAAGGAASRNLRLIRSLSIELGVVVERQNEYNRLQALSSKGFEAGRRLQERITDIRDLGVQPEERIRSLRSQAAQVISDSRIGDQQAYSESLRSAEAAVARAERDAKQLVKSASDINEEYQKQLSLRDKIGDSALDAATKESLSVQAARALEALMENRLVLAKEITEQVERQLKLESQALEADRTINSTAQLANQQILGAENALTLAKDLEAYGRSLEKTKSITEDILSLGEDLGKDFDERLKKLDAEKKLRADIQLAEQKVTGAEESFGLARDLESYSKALENTRGITEDILSLGEGLGRDFDERLKKLDAEKKLRSDIASAAELAAQKISGREESFGLARDLELYSKSLQKTQDVTEEILSLGKNLGKDFDERLKKLDSEKKLRADIASAAELAAQKISGAESSLGLGKDIEAYLNGLQKVENATKDILSLGEGLGKDFDKRLKKITTEKKLKEDVAIEIASAAISEQSLINLQNKGVNVATELLSLQEALNEAKRIDGQISQETLDNLKKQITFANKKATLENRRLAGKRGSGKTAFIDSQRIEDLQEALRNRRFGPIARATNEELEELARRLQDIRNKADATGDEFRRLGRDLAVIGREQERRDPGAEFLTRRVGPRTGRAISEGLVGGAFPLLFGQGIGSSILGGAGGALGGFAGGGLGFGLSLAGTAAGQAVDNFINSIKTLGESLKDPAQTLTALEEAGFAVDDSVKQTVEQLLEANKVYEAQAVALRQITDTLGPGSVELLNAYDKESKKLNSSYQDLAASTTRSLLPALVGAVAAINGLSDGTKNIQIPSNVLKVLSLLSPSQLIAGGSAELLAQRGRQAAQEAGRPDLPDNPAAAEAAQKARETADQLERQAATLRDQIRLAELNGGLTDERVFNLRKSIIFQEAALKLAEDGLTTEQRAVIELERKLKLQNLLNERVNEENRAREDAARKAEQAAEKEEQTLRTLVQLSIAGIDTAVKTAEIDQGRLAAIQRELNLLGVRKQLEEESILLSSKDARIQESKFSTLDQEYRNKQRLLQLERARLTLSKEQQTIDATRARRGQLESIQQESSGFAAQLNDPFNTNPERLRAFEAETRSFQLIRAEREKLADLEREAASISPFASAEQVQRLAQQIDNQKAFIPALEAELALRNQLAAAASEQSAIIEKYGFLANELSTAMSSAVQAVVTGTGTVEEAFATMFQNIGRAFIDMATQMLAQKLFMTVLGALGGGSGFNFAGGSAASGLSAANLMGGTGPLDAGMFGFRANGGPVNANEPYIVGERGPELFIPFQQGSITSNEDLEAQMRETGSAPMAFAKAGADGKNGDDTISTSEKRLLERSYAGMLRETREERSYADRLRETESSARSIEGTERSYADRLRETREERSYADRLRETREERSYADRLRETREVMLPFTRSSEQASMIAAERETAQAISNPGPIDVRYESQVINGVEYITAEQHRKGMAQAAERGRALTLQALQNSVKTRSRVGI